MIVWTVIKNIWHGIYVAISWVTQDNAALQRARQKGYTEAAKHSHHWFRHR